MDPNYRLNGNLIQRVEAPVIGNLVNDELGDYCEVDSDCVPNNCCHADSCVSVDNAPECEGVRCTLSCEPGTLDCGQGSCGCVNNRCSASIKENR